MREYIGSRYVPKFMGVHDATQAYEALCVVDNGQGTSYITKKPTPAGTPLTDSDYWFIYGTSSGAIINLQNQIDDMNDGSISGSLQNQIDTLDAIKTNKPRKLLVIGNSYVYFGVTDILESTFDTSYENVESATGFLPYTDTSKNFPDQLVTVINDPSIPNDEITDILFVSAMGDSRAYTASPSTWANNVNAAMTSIMNNIESHFTNCEKVSLTLAETRSIPYFADNKYNSLFAIHKAFKELCFNRGINYLGWSGFNALFNSDYVQNDHYHPSATGNKVIGEWIKNAYYGTVTYRNLWSRSPIDFLYTADGTLSCHVELTPETCNIRLGNFSTTSGTPITISANSIIMTTADCTIPAPAMIGGNPSIETAVTRSSSGVNDNMLLIELASDSNGILQFYNYFNPQNVTTGASSLSFSGLTNIYYIL